MGSIAEQGSLWYNLGSCGTGGWTLFNQMPVVFALGIPIGLAKKANGRAALETFVIYMTFIILSILFNTIFFFGIDMSMENSLELRR